MAIVKATYTKSSKGAKASIRYIEHRPGKEGAKVKRTLFNGDGLMGRWQANRMIDEAAKGSLFFRIVISPDPKREDTGKDLLLRDITEQTMLTLEEQLQQEVQWVAAVHDDHAPHRHIHIVAVVPGRLQVQNFQAMRQTATEAALEQRQQRDLALAQQARFAKRFELAELLQKGLCPDGVLLGTRRDYLFFKRFVAVHPNMKRREIGNTLIVAPTRGGKGLLAISQLLTWKHSVIVNDIKGELFAATAGYRATLGNVFVIDPTGYGHCYDPLLEKKTEDALLSAASHLLYQADEGEGRIFTQRATVMLAQLFAAAKLEGMSPLPYVRQCIRLGLSACAARLNAVSPELSTQFLDVNYQDANFTDRFLLSSWGTLTARLRPLLTETVVRCFTASDFTAETMMKGERPATIYLRWKEQDLLALSPLVRLVWGSLINELLTLYDDREGKGCKPVLVLIDEAGRTAIPTLADQATTVVGRGISLWIAVQSLSQLEVVYGKARAQVLRDNMESQIYYRPVDLATAQHLEVKLGRQSAYAHSTTEREGTEPSVGQIEQPVPLLTAQEIMQLSDEDILCFHRQLPPFQLRRMDWRQHPILEQKRNIPPPQLQTLPQIADLPEEISQTFRFPQGYIDPDRQN